MVYPFLAEEIPHAYAAADLVVSRAGAATLTEIAANGKPAIIIPIKDRPTSIRSKTLLLFRKPERRSCSSRKILAKIYCFEKIEENYRKSGIEF